MSERLNEYLAREAGEYLDQMATLLGAPAAPDPDALLRLARGARGSAQLAGAEAVASVAERVEDVVRPVAARTVPWNGEVRHLVLQTVRDLQILLRAMNRWGPDEEARVRGALDRFEAPPAAGGAAVVPISDLFYDDEGPHVLSAPVGLRGDEVVEVETLLLRGEEALREALALRPRVEAALGAGSEARALVDELFDLVRLGLPEDPAAA